MTARLGGSDPALDRELDKVPLPRVPAGLADRIVTQATRLPQEQPRQPMPVTPPSARRKLTAYAAALVVTVGLAGTALFSLQGSGENAPLLAGAPPALPASGPGKSSAAGLATAEDTAANATRAVTGPEHIGKQITHTGDDGSQTSPHVTAPRLAEQASPDRAQPLPTPQAVQPRLTPEKPAMLAQGAQVEAKDVGPVDQPSSPAAVYGPPAPTQGLGIAGGALGQISTQGAPRSESTRSGPTPGAGIPPRGGPPSHP